MPDRTPVHLFYTYAHEDEALRKELEKHLSLLQRQGLLASWHDREIQAGTEWQQEIDEHLDTASLILLLISPDFLASDYCYDIEMQRAIERHKRGEARVIPVILRPCDWQSAPFGTLQALPRQAKPITTWDNQDEAFKHVAQPLRRLLEQPTSSLVRPTARTILNRERMRQRLQLWYQDFLDDSLQQATWLELDLAEKPDALAHPVSLLIRDARLPDRPLPAGTSIIQVYEQANQELLILGEPGAGKSTQLYTIGQHLLSQAETHPIAALPFVFTLSSWASKQDPMETWMAGQLTQIYKVPKLLAQQWVKDHQIVPLLDGLDEMEEAARPRCVQEINRYHQEHLHPLVVCCRSAEYQAATQIERLTLQRAVVVQPLNQEQITATLSKGGEALAGLRTAYKQNTALQELATVPLLLNLLILTYQGPAVRDLPTKGELLLEHVLRTYVERMVARKGDSTRYPLDITTHWLTFLASQMRRQNLTEFVIEQLQPDWLTRRVQQCYRWSLGLSVGSVVGLISGLLVGLTSELVIGLSAGLLVGLTVGLSVVLMRGREETIALAERIQWSWSKARFGLGLGLSVGLLTWLAFGLSVGVIGGLSAWLLFGLTPNQNIDRSMVFPEDGLRNSLKNGLSVVLIGGLSLGLMGGLSFGLLGMLSVGLMPGLFVGLGAFLQHITLRFWLWQSDNVPFLLVPFLEDARARHLLKRLGGTYQFIHRQLLDYFADQQPHTDAPQPTSATPLSNTSGDAPSGAVPLMTISAASLSSAFPGNQPCGPVSADEVCHLVSEKTMRGRRVSASWHRRVTLRRRKRR